MNARARARHGRRTRRATIQNVANATGVTPQAVQRWIKAGWLRASYGAGNKAYIRWTTLNRAITDPRIQMAIAKSLALRAKKALRSE